MKLSSPKANTLRHPRVPARGFFLCKMKNKIRIISFIDGFNLYHAIKEIKAPHLKWLDLRLLSQCFILNESEELSKVLYFSAIATHLEKAIQQRHKIYIDALKLRGVTPILGRFKRKDRKCPDCDYKWEGHEEKATDVNIALHLLNLAYQDEYDRAILISNDSDLVPAISMVRELFPEKRIAVVAPPIREPSKELIRVASDKARITKNHLERCLLDEVVFDASKNISVHRPLEYAAPTQQVVSDFSNTGTPFPA